MIDSVLGLLLSVVLALLSGVLFGEKETIIRHRTDSRIKTWAQKRWFPDRLKNWWLANNWHYNSKILDWLMRYPLAIFKDGYHWCGGVSVFLLICSVMFWVLLYDLLGAIIAVPLIYYIIHGIGANTAMHDWNKNL